MSSDLSFIKMSKPVIQEIPSISSTPRSNNDVPQSPSKGSEFAGVTSTRELQIAELQGKKVSVGEEELIKVIEKANKAIEGITTSFEFRIHEATKQIMVKVLNKETGETVREIPPEKVLDMVAKLWEKAGLVVDERL